MGSLNLSGKSEKSGFSGFLQTAKHANHTNNRIEQKLAKDAKTGNKI